MEKYQVIGIFLWYNIGVKVMIIMTKIKEVFAREIIDSRGNPTV